MDLGAFSISLAVRDLEASRAFYEKLGFTAFGGDPAQNWLILKNGDHVIGLFQGMFDKNMLTFNPGWGQDAEELESFTDVRELPAPAEGRGPDICRPRPVRTAQAPASFIVLDPDGNPILVDQHR